MVRSFCEQHGGTMLPKATLVASAQLQGGLYIAYVRDRALNSRTCVLGANPRYVWEEQVAEIQCQPTT